MMSNFCRMANIEISYDVAGINFEKFPYFEQPTLHDLEMDDLIGRVDEDSSIDLDIDDPSFREPISRHKIIIFDTDFDTDIY